MPENKHLRFLLKLFYLLLGALGAWILLTVLLPWLLPFLLALALAALLERPVTFLMDRAGLPRWGAAMACTLALVLLLGGGLGLLLWRAGYEIALLLGRLPTLLSGLPTLGHRLEDLAYRFIVAAPVQYQDFFRQALDSLLKQGLALPTRFYDALAAFVTSAAAALPGAGLFLFTTALATYFSSAGRSGLLAFLRRQVPRAWRPWCRAGKRQLLGAFAGWLRAQATLMLITFGELAVGFLLLRVDLALLLAALVALVDALPVFGTGTVLLPWAVLALLGGDAGLALGLLAVYAAVSCVRSLLEPKLVGDKVGLPPLAALLAMYVGFRAFGVAGMILSPLAAILIKQLHDCGLIRLWRD